MQKRIKTSGWHLCIVMLASILLPNQGVAQTGEMRGNDLISVPDTLISRDSLSRKQEPDSLAVNLTLLKRYVSDSVFWKADQQSYRKALIRLIKYIESYPVEPTVDYLQTYPYPRFLPEQDTSLTPSDIKMLSDTAVFQRDTLTVPGGSQPPARGDSAALLPDTLNLNLQDTVLQNAVSLPPDSFTFLPRQGKVSGLSQQKVRRTYYRGDSIPVFLSDSGYVASLDTLREAVAYLIRKVENDSSKLWVTSLQDRKVGIWLRNKPEKFTRFWVKNEEQDSIGLWIHNLSRDQLQLILDDNVIFHRLSRKEKRQSALIPTDIPDGSKLIAVRPVVINKNPWKFGGIGGVNLSQGMLSNWAKGGESSISTLWELNAFANYGKKNIKWTNTFNFKYGILKSGDKGLRKNEDVWELDSRYGLKRSAHWYYSAALNLKSQIARGYKYPDDSTVVSRFFAPGYLFLSLGMDYSPNKKVSLLISPLTGRITFVTDTALIDQTLYGLKSDKKVRQDVGAYFKSQIEYDFSKDMSLTSKLNLFSQYNAHPLNIDIDWEAIFRVRLGPYFNINVSTHIIYDDDIKFPRYDAEGNKIGTTPKLQFKEWLNVGFSYKF